MWEPAQNKTHLRGSLVLTCRHVPLAVATRDLGLAYNSATSSGGGQFERNTHPFQAKRSLVQHRKRLVAGDVRRCESQSKPSRSPLVRTCIFRVAFRIGPPNTMFTAPGLRAEDPISNWSCLVFQGKPKGKEVFYGATILRSSQPPPHQKA